MSEVGGPPDLTKISALVVHGDAPEVCALAGRVSERGHEVRSVAGGAEALAALERRPARLLVVSSRLPDMDVLELCRSISTSERYGFVYVLLFADPRHEPSIIEAFDAGVADLLSTPVDDRTLDARLRAAARIIGFEQDLTTRAEQVLATNARIEAANRELETVNAQLSHMATTDELTGLPNRRTAMARLAEFWSFSSRHGVPLSCILFDIDRFKAFNDTYGHAVGDRVLRETAANLRRFARVEDVVTRIGGEEFLVLCPHTNADRAAEVAERHRRVIEAHQVHYEGGILRVCVSAGVAERGESMRGIDDLLAAADHALYGAKRSGRNRVCVDAQGGEATLPRIGKSLDDQSSSLEKSCILLLCDDGKDDPYVSLLERAGYEVSVSPARPSAIDALAVSPPQVVIACEPSEDGDVAATIRQLKANPAVQSIPVVLVGPRDPEESWSTILANGIEEYVSLPLRPQELLMRVRAMMMLNASRQMHVRSNEARAEQARMLTLVLEYTRALAIIDDLDTMLERTVAAVSELTFSRRVSIMLPDAEERYLKVASAVGIDPDVIEDTRIAVGSGIAGRVFVTRRSHVINTDGDAGDDQGAYTSRFYASVPMICGDELEGQPVVGVLNASNRFADRPFEPRELEAIDLISNIAAAAIHETQVRQARDESRNAAVAALAKLAAQRDGATGRHLDRVTEYCVVLAEKLRAMGRYTDEIDDTFIADLRKSVPLHDIGKVAVPDAILLKPGKLTPSELAIMRRHVDVGRETIQTLSMHASGVGFLAMAEDVVGGHHEWYDGTGYPNGLKGDDIPLSARIAAVADAYDAITSSRSYKDATPHDEAVALIRVRSSTQFDPAVVEAFFECRKQYSHLALSLRDDEADEDPALDRHVA